MFDTGAATRLFLEEMRSPRPAEAVGGTVGASPESGGCHFRYSTDRPFSEFFGEYWYFNFTDIERDVYGMVAYSTFDPAGLLGRGNLSVVLHEPGRNRAFSEMDSYPMSQVTADYDKTDVTIATGNRVWAERPGLYHLEGATKRGNARFELTFEQADLPLVVSLESPGQLWWEYNSWVIQMPAAKVTGHVVLNGTRYEISGPGYHDHSWGSWLLPARIWAWGVCSIPEEQFTCVFGYKTAFERSTVYVRYGDQRFRMDVPGDPDPSLSWQAGATDIDSPWILWPFPTDIKVQGYTDTFRVEGGWKVTGTGLMVPPSPIAMFEQKALVSVRLLRLNRTGGWDEVVARADVPGHSEFVSRWYHPTPAGRLDV